jgi:hypothetical protein
MQNVSPSCPRICSWHAASKVKGIKTYVKIYLKGVEKRITKASECL